MLFNRDIDTIKQIIDNEIDNIDFLPYSAALEKYRRESELHSEIAEIAAEIAKDVALTISKEVCRNALHKLIDSYYTNEQLEDTLGLK